MGVAEGVAVLVGDAVRVAVGVTLRLAVRVADGVDVAEGGTVAVKVGVWVGDAVGTGLLVAADVAVIESVGVAVGVAAASSSLPHADSRTQLSASAATVDGLHRTIMSPIFPLCGHSTLTKSRAPACWPTPTSRAAVLLLRPHRSCLRWVEVGQL